MYSSFTSKLETNDTDLQYLNYVSVNLIETNLIVSMAKLQKRDCLYSYYV